MATVTYIREAKQHVSAMKAVMGYCQRMDKTTDPETGHRYVTGLNCNGENAFMEFLATKTAYDKLDGINFYQYVQSFPPGRTSPMPRLMPSGWSLRRRPGRGMRCR